MIDKHLQGRHKISTHNKRKNTDTEDLGAVTVLEETGQEGSNEAVSGPPEQVQKNNQDDQQVGPEPPSEKFAPNALDQKTNKHQQADNKKISHYRIIVILILFSPVTFCH